MKRTDSNKKYPYIETSLEDKMTTSKSYVDFTLDARDENGAALDDYLYISHNRYPNVYTYHYKSGSYFTKDEWCEIFKNTKDHKFRVNLKHGKNVITIRTDETDNVRLETKRTIYCNSKSTGAVTIGIEANTLSLGKLAPEEKCLIYKHDTVLDIINKYLNDSDFNFELEYWDMYTSIINRISKENITKDAKVPENLINAINANEKYNYEKRSYKKDSISLNDFADGSAWTVSINGQITFGQQIYEYSKAKNNQKITIAFSLTGDGADLDGTLKW